ncbi:HET-domain-containing protein, partial [Dichomitus squalens LYAD-421 SS1]
MRFLHAPTGTFSETRYTVDQLKADGIPYACLSHVWSKPGRRLSSKIQRFCDVVKGNGIELAWADSCCINQDDLAEVQPAVNSMFTWYRNATLCVVFLHDVDDYPGHLTAQWATQFCDSGWFTRCWTLQELLGPDSVIFYSRNWRPIMDKATLSNSGELAALVECATGIPPSVLEDPRSLANISVAQKISWGALRRATKPEDASYSLAGLLGVSLNVRYGITVEEAFQLLLSQVLQRIPDHTVLLWGHP